MLYFTERSQWRSWLSRNHRKESEAWLVNAKKTSGKKRIPYNDAVEEALCFNWIDSINKTLDADYAMQRYTPRRAISSFSQPNIERLRWLDSNGMIHPDYAEMVKELIHKEYIFPSDILDQLKKEALVWDNFQNFKGGYQRIRIAYIDASRDRPEEFSKRLERFIQYTRNNLQIPGYGGIEKYYNL